MIKVTALMFIKKNQWKPLIPMAICLSMVLWDSAFFPISFPTIKHGLEISASLQPWILNAHFFILASMLSFGGKIADLFGRRYIFCLGIAVFACACILESLANSAIQLIFFRGLQGLGAALMFPASMALLTEIFPIGERGRAIGITVSISSVFLSMGPYFGGLLVDRVSWRYIFLINVPLAVLAIALAIVSLPKSEKIHSFFDMKSFFFFFLGLGSFTFVMTEIKQIHESSYLIFFLFLLSCLFFYLFYKSTKYANRPFINFSLFNNFKFLSGNILMFCLQILVAMGAYWPIYFQTLFHFTPLQTGRIMLFATLPVTVFAPLSGIISDKLGPKIVAQIGFLLLFSAFSWMYFLNLEADPFMQVIPSLLMYGCGVSLIMTPISTMTMSCFPTCQNGEAAGIYNTVRFF